VSQGSEKINRKDVVKRIRRRGKLGKPGGEKFTVGEREKRLGRYGRKNYHYQKNCSNYLIIP